MNLDLDMLKEMISSTLTELNEPAVDTEAEEKAKEKAEAASEAADAAKEAADDVADEAEQEQAAEERAAEEADAQAAVQAESFEITRGRLRQIIAEELISAKKQGIL